ncbi:hypothetical protein [Streptomyces sp. Isolate_45]|uniref:hypothetical protein n=1 Tax=Streptomyces sp. Isolate_45 TaxID=2950111 RepID=UPI0024819A24|nr:hypothetical protein [Streptomyces sp. Isolate_45]MDA5285046.1 hypothetical protein [Streptomyces sp. Isolate_45]
MSTPTELEPVAGPAPVTAQNPDPAPLRVVAGNPLPSLTIVRRRMRGHMRRHMRRRM